MDMSAELYRPVDFRWDTSPVNTFKGGRHLSARTYGLIAHALSAHNSQQDD